MSSDQMTPLAEVLAEHPEEDVQPDQPGYLDGEVVNLHAVLERTAVLGPPILDVGDRRELVRIDRVLVDAGALQWQPKLTPLQGAWTLKARARGQAQANAARKKTPV